MYIYYTYMRALVQAAFDYRMASPIGVYPIPWGPSDDHGNMSSHNRNEHVQTSNIFVMQLCRLWYPNWDIGNSTLMIYTRSLCRSCDILCMIYI